jgi:DNA-directed RNA polymerase subunit RPC12/RpoP
MMYYLCHECGRKIPAFDGVISKEIKRHEYIFICTNGCSQYKEYDDFVHDLKKHLDESSIGA